MMANKANRGVLYLILGFVILNLAVGLRMNATATFRSEMVEDMKHTNEQLQRIESKQDAIVARQRTTMLKLNMPFPESEAATQP